MFDINLDDVGPGHIFNLLQLHVLFGHRPGTTEFSLACMNFARWVEHELWKSGRCLTVRVSTTIGVLVLEHLEASVYNRRWFRSGYKRMVRCHKRAAAVDTSAFTIQQRREHERMVELMARDLLAIRECRRPPNEPPHHDHANDPFGRG